MKNFMTRRTAREILIKIFYQTDVNGDSDSSEYLERVGKEDDLKEYISTCDIDEDAKVTDTGEQMNFIRKVSYAWDMHRSEIDEKIAEYAINWKLERIAKMDLAILREAAAEIMYIDEVPCAVTINEAVELAKLYGTERAPKFVNAVLGKIAGECENE